MLLEELPKYAQASVFDKMTLCAMWCKPEDSLHSGQFTKFPSGGLTRGVIVKPPDGNLVNPTLCTGTVHPNEIVARRGPPLS